MEPTIVYFVAAAGAAGLATGWLLGRWVSAKAAALLAVILLIGAAVLLLMGRQATGWDGIGYTILAVLILTPAALGVAAGGWIGNRQRNRAAPR